MTEAKAAEETERTKLEEAEKQKEKEGYKTEDKQQSTKFQSVLWCLLMSHLLLRLLLLLVCFFCILVT